MSASFSLFPVVEQLGREQVLDLIWDSVVGIIYNGSDESNWHTAGGGGRTCKIRTGLMGARSGTGRLPSRDVHGLEILGHLCYLDRIKTENP